MELSKIIFKEEEKTKRLKLFNKYFVGEMEAKLRGFNSELKGQVLKQGKSVEIGSFAGETVGTVVGATLGLLTGGQMIAGSAKIGGLMMEKLSGLATKKYSEKSRKKRLGALANVIEDFGEKQNTDESRKEWREFVVSISHTLFQSYEMQIMTVESSNVEEYYADALHYLARDAVDRIIDYAVSNGRLCAEGILYGKSKTNEFIAMPEWNKPDVLPKGFEIKYNGNNCRTTDLYEKVGWAIWKSTESREYYCVCKSLKGIKISEPENFGFRRTFQDEDVTNLINISKRISASDYSKFTKYEYWNNYEKNVNVMLEILMTDLENGDTTFMEKRVEEIAKEVSEYVKLIFSGVEEGLVSLRRIEKSTIQTISLTHDTHDKLDNLTDNLTTFKVMLKIAMKKMMTLMATIMAVVSVLFLFALNSAPTSDNSEAMVKMSNEIKGGVSTLDESIYFDKKECDHIEDKNIYFDMKDPVELFTGREKELVDLHNLIQRNSKKTEVETKKLAAPEMCTIITGLGGIGKTQLALRYAQLYSNEYNNNILWISAETESSISSSFTRLASEILKIKLKTIEGQKKTITSIVAEVYKFFAKTKALFIFDNADGPFSEVFFPIGGHKPFILITSRMQEWGRMEVFKLKVFTEPDAMQFVKKALNINNETQNDDVNSLVKLLDNLPLALQQALSYINETNKERKGISSEYEIFNYLNDYKQEAQSLLDYNFYNDFGIQSSITTYTTWIVTKDKIKKNKYDGQLATEILNLVSYFASNKIDPKMFLHLTHENEHKLTSAKKLLITYSMVNQEVDGLLNVHPLVQEITLLNLKAEKNEREYFQAAQILLLKYFESKNKFVERQQLILPHLESLLIKIKSWIYHNPNETRVIEIENVFLLLGALAEGYSNFDIRKTKSLLEELLSVVEKHSGPEDCLVAMALHHLGVAHGGLGDPKMEKNFLERALAIQEKHYGPEHYQVAQTLNNLGVAHGALGDPKMMKDFLERALAIQVKHYGPEYYQVAITLHNLGVAHGALGDPKMMKDFLERALAIQVKHYGPEHYEVAITLRNLGVEHGALGDPKMMKDFLERALAIQEKHYGPEHYEVAITLHFLRLAHNKEMQNTYIIIIIIILFLTTVFTVIGIVMVEACAHDNGSAIFLCLRVTLGITSGISVCITLGIILWMCGFILFGFSGRSSPKT